jgi:O-methyltransferase involved in polyketide biosynthesis
MADEEVLVPGIDTTRPSVARVYDFWLGGKDHYLCDREMGRRMAELNPALPQLVRDNRAFLAAAAGRAAEAGIGQFLDLGAGLPSHPAIHEAAREINKDTRVCYVDNDLVAVRHAQALLARGPGLASVSADLRDPDAVLADPGVLSVIDLAQPTAVIFGAVLHFLPAEAAAAICARYVNRMAAGSWLIVSTGHYDDAVLAARLQETAAHARFHNHDAATMASWLTGLKIVPPGICEGRAWAAGTGGVPVDRQAYALAAAAIKPV